MLPASAYVSAFLFNAIRVISLGSLINLVFLPQELFVAAFRGTFQQ